MIFLVYCIVLLCICVVSCLYVIYYPTVMARYSLFVLKVPLTPKQTNIIIRVQVTGFVHNASGGSQNLIRRVVEVRVFQHGQRYVRGTLSQSAR